MSDKHDSTALLGRLLFEFITKVDISWSHCYFRYVERDIDHISFEWSYRFGDELLTTPKGRELSSQYFEVMGEMLSKLLSEIESTGLQKPKTAVVMVDFTGVYNISFAHDDKALAIGVLELGSQASYFKEGEIRLTAEILEIHKAFK